MMQLVHSKPKLDMRRTYSVLCVDDDPVIQLMLKDVVEGTGAQCALASSAEEARQQLDQHEFHLAVLDRKLPDSDGLLLIQEIKSRCACPIVILSTLDQTRDKILGIGLGAVEYLTKPINPVELSARIHSLLTSGQAQHAADENRFTTPLFSFDTRSRRLSNLETSVHLPPAEARLLHALLLNEGELQTRDQLLRFSCGREWVAGDRTVDVLINRLRAHLRRFSVEIVTVHRAGYMLAL